MVSALIRKLLLKYGVKILNLSLGDVVFFSTTNGRLDDLVKFANRLSNTDYWPHDVPIIVLDGKVDAGKIDELPDEIKLKMLHQLSKTE